MEYYAVTSSEVFDPYHKMITTIIDNLPNLMKKLYFMIEIEKDFQILISMYIIYI